LSQVTHLIESVRNGDEGASESLLVAVYGELYSMAQRQFSNKGSGHTLQTTALVNEAFIRLFGGTSNPSWENRAHFFGAAAEAMRRILVDHARRKQAIKRGGDRVRMTYLDDSVCQAPILSEVIDVNDALNDFAVDYPMKAELVKLRYFAGLSIVQSAEVMQISVPTANRYWAFARAWLFERIRND